MTYVPMKRDAVRAIGVDPIPAKPFYDEGYFQLERTAVFRRAWLQVGRVSELAEPGRFVVRTLEVAGASILMTHAADGKLRAFHNACTHRGTELVGKSSGKASRFTCRYHAWTFGADGALRAIPDEESFFDIDKSKCGLREVALDTCGGFIFINLDPEPRQTLQEFLGDWAERLEVNFGGKDVYIEYVYEAEANWKDGVDNFQENYHAPFIHQYSIGPAMITDANPFGYPGGYTFVAGQPHSTMDMLANPDYVPSPTQKLAFTRNPPEVVESTTKMTNANDYMSIFPNMVGMGGAIPFTQTVWPLGAGRYRSVIRQYWKGKDVNASQLFTRELCLATTIDVHCEDVELVEAAHRGLSSGAIEFMHLQAHEAMVRHHFNSVDEYVQTYRRENRPHDTQDYR